MYAHIGFAAFKHKLYVPSLLITACLLLVTYCGTYEIPAGEEKMKCKSCNPTPHIKGLAAI